MIENLTQAQTAEPYMSVIIPMYNAENHIEACLGNLGRQTLANIEIICIDDGSTDHTFDKVCELTQNDPRIRCYKQKNAGAGAARNLGIFHARGQYIAFLDSDDEFAEEDTLQSLYENALQGDFSIVGGHMLVLLEGKELIRSFDGEFEGYSFQKTGNIDYKDYQFDFGFTRFIYNKKLFKNKEIRFPELYYYEDPVFMVKTFLHAERFLYLNKPTYFYKFTHTHVDWKSKERQVIDLFRGIEENLRISKLHRLSKLHWYTIKHFNMSYNLAVRLGGCYTWRVEASVYRACRHMDLNLASQWKSIDSPFRFCLRRFLIQLKQLLRS